MSTLNFLNFEPKLDELVDDEELVAISNTDSVLLLFDNINFPTLGRGGTYSGFGHPCICKVDNLENDMDKSVSRTVHLPFKLFIFIKRSSSRDGRREYLV